MRLGYLTFLIIGDVLFLAFNSILYQMHNASVEVPYPENMIS
jgi:hypothetical protein